MPAYCVPANCAEVAGLGLKVVHVRGRCYDEPDLAKRPAFDEVSMPLRNRTLIRVSCFGLAMFVSALTAGCGFNAIQQATLPAQAAGLTLAELDAILSNSALTDMEQQDAIRAAIGAPMDDNGDRLVNFLFNFTVP